MRIVIVDNDRSLLRSLEIVLSGRGHEVRCFSDPADATAYVKTDPRLGALLVDYLMPSMTGTAFLARIGEELPESCGVIMITGHADEIEREELVRTGVFALHPKPLDLAELLRTLETLEGLREESWRREVSRKATPS